MNFSQLIFPAPSPPNYSHDSLVGELIYVPKDFSECPHKYIKDRIRTISASRLRQGGFTSRNGEKLADSKHLRRNMASVRVLREISENSEESKTSLQGGFPAATAKVTGSKPIKTLKRTTL